MHDLNTINRLNAEATERSIPALQAQGKFVVAEYHGLHLVGHSAHDTEADAQAKAAEVDAAIGHHSTISPPL